MHLTPEGKFVRSDFWREGKWLDAWSIVHFFSGATAGFFPLYLGLPAVAAFPIAFLLFVMYEMWEAMVKIEETGTNRVMDVVVGMASFTPVFFLNSSLDREASLALWTLCAAFAFVLSFFGWRSSQKAYVLETRMRAEFEIEKKKLAVKIQGRKHFRRRKRRSA